MSQQSFISGQNQPDDQPEHQNHNIYIHSFENFHTQVSSKGAMAITGVCLLRIIRLQV